MLRASVAHLPYSLFGPMLALAALICAPLPAAAGPQGPVAKRMGRPIAKPLSPLPGQPPATRLDDDDGGDDEAQQHPEPKEPGEHQDDDDDDEVRPRAQALPVPPAPARLDDDDGGDDEARNDHPHDGPTHKDDDDGGDDEYEPQSAIRRGLWRIPQHHSGLLQLNPASHHLGGQDGDGVERLNDDEEGGDVSWVIRDRRRLRRDIPLSLGVGIWPDTFSIGALLNAPAVPRGFIKEVNDSFGLEFGLMVAAVNLWGEEQSTQWRLWPMFGGRWDFFLTPNWSTFITAKLFGIVALNGDQPFPVSALVGAGAHYRINNHLGLRMELNFPQGLVFALALPLGHTHEANSRGQGPYDLANAGSHRPRVRGPVQLSQRM